MPKTSKTSVDIDKLASAVVALEKKVVALEGKVDSLKSAPAAGGDVHAELSRVAKLVDQIVAIIRSPTARITDRNVI
jgi:outer membrane murein-binding lipoprotein Lpp